ncbi:MAG: glucose-6-phosphate isomerase [Candidatus Omnitrophica bacterium]|nr:glucose-6-phosphate isomerase [Candidatus Omnitrophota bacterium]
MFKKRLKLNTKCLKGFVSERDFRNILPEVEKAHAALIEKNSRGKEFLGWVDFPEEAGPEFLKKIETTGGRINSEKDAVIVIGIGGSYLGARSIIETLAPRIIGKDIFFAGYNLSGDFLNRLLSEVKDRDVNVIVISKSGTTTEPALAFRIIKDFLMRKYSAKELKSRIICVTDKEKGALKRLAEEEGYESFVIPDDIGGRFSVLTAVGLLPVASAGINIRELLDGAKAQRKYGLKSGAVKDISCRYAAIRNILYRSGKKIEILSSFDNSLHYFDEWWKQLFGESEGKNGRSIFPASCDFSTDLHSMGQLIQQGERNLFETFLVAEKNPEKCRIPTVSDDLDNLNYLAGKSVDHVNRKAYEATRKAHFDGGVPNMTVFFGGKSAFCLGQLFYFFEKAAAISGYLAGVNPFDQPGVEAYKREMFKLLGKP